MSKRQPEEEIEAPELKKQKIDNLPSEEVATPSTEEPAPTTEKKSEQDLETCDLDDPELEGVVPPERKLPKKKIALLIGFCGLGYQGMQM